MQLPRDIGLRVAIGYCVGLVVGVVPQRLRQRLDNAVNAPQGAVISGVGVIVIVMRVGQDGQLVHRMIEDDQRIGQHESDSRHIQVIAGGMGQVFKVTHNVIGHIADGAADQPRQPFQRHGIHRLEVALDDMQRILAFGDGELGLLSIALKRHDIVLDAEHALGVDADEGIAPDLFAAFDALQQESRLARLFQLHVNGHRRLEVAQERTIHRHMVALGEVVAHLGARWFDILALAWRRSQHGCPSLAYRREIQKNPNHPVKDEKGSRGATLITRRGESLMDTDGASISGAVNGARPGAG